MLINYHINSLFFSTTYIIGSHNNVIWVVDCGDVEPVLRYLQGKQLMGVLLTHAHFDHIYGLNELLKHFPEALVYTNEAGQEALLDEKKNMSFYHETPFVFEYTDRIRIVADGDEIVLSDELKAKVIATPGHHPSCLTYIIDNAIFTGDSYIPDVKVVTNLPKGNKKQAQESVERILSLSEGKTIYPGHHVT